MVDNSWVNSDRETGDPRNRAIRLKVILTVLIVVAGAGFTILLNGVGSNATQYQSEGIVIDFGNYTTVWTNISFTETSDPKELLEKACDSHYGTAPVFTDGVLTAIDTGEAVIANDDTHTWGLWYVSPGTFDFIKSDSYNIKASDYTVLSWAYTVTDGKPAVGVDATATSIYGYAQPHDLVTLSPVCTEIVGAMDAANMIVGTDQTSNYPSSVVKGKVDHTISEVGTYTDPSYEAIMNVSPDLVVCDASAYSHKTMATTLRNSNVNSVVIYDGTDLETVLNNIFIVGVAMNYEQRAQYVASQIDLALDKIIADTSAHTGGKTLVTLSAMPSPYVAGTNTYVNDILYTVKGSNALNDSAWPSGTPNYGWPNISASIIKKINPSYIIIFDYGQYHVGDYELMMSSLSDEWKNTDAYANGNIYLFADGLGEMAQRSGPRIAQLTEIVARIINPEAFGDEISVPKAIGDDYQSYLSYTKHLGFGD